MDPRVAKAHRERLEADPVERILLTNGFNPWSKQAEIIRALYEHRRVAVQSCHGVGKTAVAAAIVEDFMAQGPCRIVTTAPTNHQVEALLWGEIRKRARSAKIKWERQPSKKKWEIRDDWAAFGFSTNEPERFSGHHGRRLLFVVDEASGVKEEIFTASKGFLTGKNSFVLMISNPTQMAGTFYENCQPTKERWHNIKISALDCPSFTGEAVHPDLADELPQPEWVDEMREDWEGEDSPEFKVRVLGEFAPVWGRLYFPPKHVHAVAPEPFKREGYLAGDVARGGRVSFTEEKNGPLRIWSVPDKSKHYAIFGDVAGQVREDDYEMRERVSKASGDDFCAAIVLDLETGEMVAEYREQTDPDKYGRMLARLGYVYAGIDRCAWLGVESNSMGQAALSELKNARYPRLWRRSARETARQARAPKLGLETNKHTRERMLTFLGATLRERPERIKSELVKFELERFVKDEMGFGEAATGFHDDLVIALAGVLEMRDQVLRRPGSDEVAA